MYKRFLQVVVLILLSLSFMSCKSSEKQEKIEEKAETTSGPRTIVTENGEVVEVDENGKIIPKVYDKVFISSPKPILNNSGSSGASSDAPCVIFNTVTKEKV